MSAVKGSLLVERFPPPKSGFFLTLKKHLIASQEYRWNIEEYRGIYRNSLRWRVPKRTVPYRFSTVLYPGEEHTVNRAWLRQGDWLLALQPEENLFTKLIKLWYRGLFKRYFKRRAFPYLKLFLFGLFSFKVPAVRCEVVTSWVDTSKQDVASKTDKTTP